MKMKLLAVSVSTALLGATAINAAVNNDNALKAPNFTAQELAQYQDRVKANRNSVQNEGLNVRVNRSENKFIHEPDVHGEQTYIVRLKHAPLAVKRASLLREQGQINGMNSIQSRSLSSQNVRAVNNYQQQLERIQAQTISTVKQIAGNVPVRHQFIEAFNGFSMNMTPSQAQAVSQLADVAFVHRAKDRQLLSDAGPQKIKADQAWTGNTDAGIEAKGEGIIMGILDTGINSDHPSFQVQGDDGYMVTNPWGDGVYIGDCEQFEQMCNDKLIGVRSYPIITRDYLYMNSDVAMNGEDYDGHGSHTASTAAGNVLYDVDLETTSQQDGVGTIVKEGMFEQVSGVAPHANIIAYQVCRPESDEGLGGCPDEALIQAVEDAIDDGVDVINYSIGGGDSSIWEDAMQMTFLAAREAGISVAAAAGNSGQACGQECFYSLDNASPWLLSVGATTHDRKLILESRLSNPTFANPAEQGSEAEFDYLAGGAVNETSVTGVIVEARDYDNVNGLKDEYCGAPYAPGTFDNYPNGDPIVDGDGNPVPAIVVCARNNLSDPNGVARTDKSDNIKAGGADGFIMWNFGANDGVVTLAEYSLPAVHLDYFDWWGGAKNGFYGLEDWIRTYGERGHTVTIEKTLMELEHSEENGDWLAPFSSRGPSFYNQNVLAPMVTAPGVDIYAAYADQHPFSATPFNADFSFVSGTSMASPHVAGALGLMRQMHPDWTPAEIQSALMSTADQTVRMYYGNNPQSEEMEAGTYRTGTGRINVKNAANAGLVFDVTSDEFYAANPLNGGRMEGLNMPYLVDMNCQPTCTWTRTVKATKDGTWKVDNDPVTNWDLDTRKRVEQNGVTLEISPSEFSLMAGEEQEITVTVDISATLDALSNSEVELHSELNLVEVNGNAPQMHLPMAFKYEHGQLPDKLVATMHADNGEKRFEGMDLRGASAPHATIYEPVKATKKQITLPKDDDFIYPWELRMDTTDPANSMEKRMDESVHIEWIDVPANSKRVVVEMLRVVESDLWDKLDKANPIIYLGKDLNGDGEVQIDDELMCMSNHVVKENFCSLADPDEGQYWAIVYNQRASDSYPEFIETVEIGYGVVSNNAATNISTSFDTTEPSDATMTLAWDMLDMQKDDLYYSLAELGSSANNSKNVGNIALNLVRGDDDISLTVGEHDTFEKTGAVPGERVPYTFAVRPNNTGVDRAFELSTKIPEGMTIAPEDVMFNRADAAEVTIEEGMLVVKGVQEDTSEVAPEYIKTTNITDATCRTPDLGNTNPGGYINLSEFSIGPSFGSFEENGRLEYHRGTSLPLAALFGSQYDSWNLYDNTKDVNHDPKALGIRGNGMIDLWGGSRAVLQNIWTMGRTYPEEMRETHLATELSPSSGISLAATANGWGVIEWDDAKTYQNFGNFRFADWQANHGDSYDFELIFNVNTRFGDNEHELYMAYDNIDYGSTEGNGMVGLVGFKGYVFTYGPLEGGLLEDWYLANENISGDIQDGLVICYDYVGPESSQFEYTVWAQVDENTYGKSLDWQTDVTLEGQVPATLAHSLKVAGNLSLPEMADMTTDENTAISFDVNVIDKLQTANTISVEADNLSWAVEGNTVTLTPDQYFYGDIDVKLMVADVDSPSDRAERTFTLTVVSDGQEQPTTVEPEPEVESSSSGSLGWFTLLLTPMLWLRRKKA